METQLTLLKKQSDEREQKRIKEKYSMEAEKLEMGNFILTRVLNNDAETRSIWLLGKFKGDPTENLLIMTLRKTEFTEDQMREIFDAPTRKKHKIQSKQYFHNSEFRKYWFNLPEELSKVQCDIMYPASEAMILKYTR